MWSALLKIRLGENKKHVAPNFVMTTVSIPLTAVLLLLIFATLPGVYGKFDPYVDNGGTLVGKSLHQSVTASISHCISQSLHQSVSQSVGQ